MKHSEWSLQLNSSSWLDSWLNPTYSSELKLSQRMSLGTRKAVLGNFVLFGYKSKASEDCGSYLFSISLPKVTSCAKWEEIGTSEGHILLNIYTWWPCFLPWFPVFIWNKVSESLLAMFIIHPSIIKSRNLVSMKWIKYMLVLGN